jgi:2'-5' RNA ligase
MSEKEYLERHPPKQAAHYVDNPVTHKPYPYDKPWYDKSQWGAHWHDPRERRHPHPHRPGLHLYEGGGGVFIVPIGWEPSTTGSPETSKSVSINPTAANDMIDTGVMICLRPPDAVCEALAVDGGEPVDNHHITLAYLGKAEDIDKNALNMAVEDWATRWASLRGVISGYGVFNNAPGDGGNALVALWDIPSLERARDDLVDTLAHYGLAPKTDHGFTPHETIRYDEDKAPTIPKKVPDAAAGQVAFEQVAAVHGPDWTWYPFLGRPGVPVAATLHEEPEPALPETDGVDEPEKVSVPARGNAGPGAYEDPEAPIKPGDSRLSWLMGDGNKSAGNSDIAHMARLYLQSPEAFHREAAKHFTPAEQQQLISEGEAEGVGASNLDRLDITGTHYEALEAALEHEDEEDAVWLA